MTKRQLPSDPLDRALLEAVLAAPADDAPRLVYADRLMERNDPRGELIVVQCTCARLEREGKAESPEHALAKTREAELLRRFERGWHDELGAEYHWTGKITRGFITDVELWMDLLRGRWGLFKAFPLESIRLSYAGGVEFEHGSKLGAFAWMARQPVLQRTRLISMRCGNGMMDLEPSKLREALRAVSLDDERRSWPRGQEPPPELANAVRALRLGAVR